MAGGLRDKDVRGRPKGVAVGGEVEVAQAGPEVMGVGDELVVVVEGS